MPETVTTMLPAIMVVIRRSSSYRYQNQRWTASLQLRNAHLPFDWLFFDRGGATQGSAGSKFSLAHCRANRLSSAAVYKLSLCLIFSQWVSIVLRLRWNCSAISRGLYAAPNN